MAWAWYGVKTLYRVAVRGRPRVRDRDYDACGSLVEERVVVVRARSQAEAMRKAEAEAASYTRGSYTNPYGQKVQLRRIRVSESFELFDPPGDKVEVWSATYVVPKQIPDQAIVERAFGPNESRAQLRKRKKYLNREFSGVARPDV